MPKSGSLLLCFILYELRIIEWSKEWVDKENGIFEILHRYEKDPQVTDKSIQIFMRYHIVRRCKCKKATCSVSDMKSNFFNAMNSKHGAFIKKIVTTDDNDAQGKFKRTRYQIINYTDEMRNETYDVSMIEERLSSNCEYPVTSPNTSSTSDELENEIHSVPRTDELVNSNCENPEDKSSSPTSYTQLCIHKACTLAWEENRKALISVPVENRTPFLWVDATTAPPGLDKPQFTRESYTDLSSPLVLDVPSTSSISDEIRTEAYDPTQLLNSSYESTASLPSTSSTSGEDGSALNILDLKNEDLDLFDDLSWSDIFQPINESMVTDEPPNKKTNIFNGNELQERDGEMDPSIASNVSTSSNINAKPETNGSVASHEEAEADKESSTFNILAFNVEDSEKHFDDFSWSNKFQPIYEDMVTDEPPNKKTKTFNEEELQERDGEMDPSVANNVLSTNSNINAELENNYSLPSHEETEAVKPVQLRIEEDGNCLKYMYYVPKF